VSGELAPLPGDPDAVSRAAEHYCEVAEAIRTAARRLRQIADERTDRSEAVAAVGSKARDVAHQVTRAHSRYAAVGGALRVYSRDLDHAQGRAEHAVRHGRAASERLETASARVLAAAAALDTATPNDLAARTRDLEDARSEQDAAQQALDRAVADLDVARTRVATAAQTAAATIREALDDGLDDGWWQDWGKDACRAIASIADNISNVFGVLAAVFALVPFFGELFALIAVVAAAVKLLADLALAMDGEVTWGDVAWDVVAIVPGGVGRAAGSMARTTAAAARGTARKEAQRLARKTVSGEPRAGTQLSQKAKKDALPKERRKLAGPSNSRLSTADADDLVRGVSGKQALKDGLDIVGWRSLMAAREARGGKSLCELWKAEPGAKFATRVMGDRELGGELSALRQVKPALKAMSPETAKAVDRARFWQATDMTITSYIGVEAFVGAQDFTDWVIGNDDFAPGGWHAFESLGGIQGDRHASERLDPSGAGR